MGLTPRALAEIMKADFILKPTGRRDKGDYLGWSSFHPDTINMVQTLPDDFDPDNFEGETRTDVIDGQEVTRYLTPRELAQAVYLSPFAEGSGWRTGRAPEKPNKSFYQWKGGENESTWADPSAYDEDYGKAGKWRNQLDVFDEDGDIVQEASMGRESYEQDMEDYNRRHSEWLDEVEPDIIDTIVHEMGHRATQGALNRIKLDPRYASNTRFDRGFDNPTTRSDKISDKMAFLMDNPAAMKHILREPAILNPTQGQTKKWGRSPSAWHERAAYTSEYPQNPGYAMGKWLHHRDVEQEQRRKHLEMVEAAQKKWGIEDPINAKRMASALKPGGKWGMNTTELRRIMGIPPERRPPIGMDEGWTPTPEPEAERLLLPPQERIYRNLRNAIINQGAGILSDSAMYETDPEGYLNRPDRPAGRRKAALELSGDALRALDSHFDEVVAGNAPLPRTIADLPENIKGEIGRLELRRILASMVADQIRMPTSSYGTSINPDWVDPDTELTYDWMPEQQSRWPFHTNLELPRSGRNRPNFSMFGDQKDEYEQLFNLYNKLKDTWDEKNRWSGDWERARYNDVVTAAAEKAWDDHNIWWGNDDYPEAGPNERAWAEGVAAEKAAMKQQISDLAEKLGITDADSIIRPKVYPDKMLSDYSFTEFEPDNPEHQAALEYWQKEAQSHYRDRDPRGERFAENMFPSLYYGLIPTQALERVPNNPRDYHYPGVTRKWKRHESWGDDDMEEQSFDDPHGEIQSTLDRVSDWRKPKRRALSKRGISASPIGR